MVRISLSSRLSRSLSRSLSQSTALCIQPSTSLRARAAQRCLLQTSTNITSTLSWNSFLAWASRSNEILYTIYIFPHHRTYVCLPRRREKKNDNIKLRERRRANIWMSRRKSFNSQYQCAAQAEKSTKRTKLRNFNNSRDVINVLHANLSETCTSLRLWLSLRARLSYLFGRVK